MKSNRLPARAGGSPAISLFGISRVFGLIPGIVRVDLVVERGETLLVQGPNGAGKSTLLRVIATALSPSYGRGTVLGFDLVRGREQIRQHSELLGHRTRLYEDLTALENLQFACALYGMKPEGLRVVLERVGLGEAFGERVRGFSQGMRQRLALARVLLRAPELLLLDEPYAGLDRQGRTIVEGAIRESQKERRTVILATHDPTAANLATRTVLMQDGRLYPKPAPAMAGQQPG